MSTLELRTLDTGAVRFATRQARIGEHDALFARPRPLWTDGTAGVGARPGPHAPVLLRYRADDFMERFLAEAALADPGWVALSREEARAEETGKAGRALVWSADKDEVDEADKPTLPFKLFLPYHGDFHLVACSFVCRRPTYPDRALDDAKEDTLSFVIRRRHVIPGVVSPTGADAQVEEAWVPGTGWVPASHVGDWDRPLPVSGEERLPLGTLAAGWGRKVHYGYLPAASRETYTTSDAGDPLSAAAAALVLLDDEVVEPLRALREEHGRGASRALARAVYDRIAANADWLEALRNGTTVSTHPGDVLVPRLRNTDGAHGVAHLGVSWWDVAAAAHDLPPDDTFPYDLTRARRAEVQWLVGSYLLTATERTDHWEATWSERIEASFAPALALLRVLEGTFPDAAVALEERWGDDGDPPATPTTELSGLDQEVYELVLEAKVERRLAIADPDHDREEVGLEECLAWLRDYRAAAVETARTAWEDGDDADVFEAWRVDVWDEVPADWPFDLTILPEAWVRRLVSLVKETVAEGFVAPKYPPQADDDGAVHFVVRSVYERGHCKPPRLLFSDASDPYVIAAPFDPDAPARDIRIPLPADLSRDALEKARKGMGMMLSNAMREKLDRSTSEGVAKADLGISPPSFGGSAQIEMGAILSLSIPIVTICAFILLMIVASILHYIFRWLPYLFVLVPTKISVKA